MIISYPISINERVPCQIIFEYSTKNNNIKTFQSSFNGIKSPLNNNNLNINKNNNIGIHNNEDKVIYPETAGIFKNYIFNEKQY